MNRLTFWRRGAVSAGDSPGANGSSAHPKIGRGLRAPLLVRRARPALRMLLFALMLMPLVTIAILAISPGAGEGQILLRYALNSITLAILVAILSAFLGIGAAYLVTRFDFAGRRILALIFMLPFALPPYLVAYALVEFFDYAGPLQFWLREEIGANFRLPRFRSFPGAVLVLSATLYPYIYIYARQCLASQSRSLHDAARVLGLKGFARFRRVELQALRPSLAIGSAIVMLEVLADFGTVDHFGIETLSTGVFSHWLRAMQLGVAARMALTLALLSLGLLALEQAARKRAAYFSIDGRAGRIRPSKLGLKGASLIWLSAILPAGFGFFLPIGIFTGLADFGAIDPAEWGAVFESIILALICALLVSGVALLIHAGTATKAHARFHVLSLIGYSMPGAVLGLGLLIPLSATDHLIASMREVFGSERAGLFITGSGMALILAYFVRFYALAQGTILAGKERITPNIVGVARVLGEGEWGAFRRVEAPLILRPIIAGQLLVFVDVLKELPATLILRPFGVETLATRLYEAAALEDLEKAAMSALLIALAGSMAVILLARHPEER